MVALIILAVLAALVGLVSLSQATLGVGLICGGCLLGVLARIAQAQAQHRELQEVLKRAGAATGLPAA
jgi:hypothetical protein